MEKIGKQNLAVLIVTCLSLLTGIIAAACQTRQPAATAYVYAVDTPRQYESLKEMTYDAAVVVQVTVKSIRTTMDQDVVTSRSEVTVSRSYKGQAAAGSVLTVIEPGGIIETDDSRINYQPNGASVMVPGDTLILFLSIADESADPPLYTPLGLYQGRFRIENNLIAQLVPADYILTVPPPQVVQVFTAEIVAAVIGQRVEERLP
ncbi:MAG: hypothetical protein SCM11_04445 [Bacillota bacterium]|nr:hypothetical protein [Bacillota bacterium]